MNIKEYKALSAREKQDALQRFVDREVRYCVSTLIGDIAEDHLLQNDIYDYLENYEENEDDVYPEIFEYWIVSDWLLSKLRDKGEVVMQYHGLDIWGRQTTGQAIMLDNVIEDIYMDMIK